MSEVHDAQIARMYIDVLDNHVKSDGERMKVLNDAVRFLLHVVAEAEKCE